MYNECMINRSFDSLRLRAALDRAPVVVLVGPRQAGKSTMARLVAHPVPGNHFDLEDPRDVNRLGDPTLSLASLEGTVVIDEAQRAPGLFPILRVLADEDRRPGRFLVLGSASPELIGMASESLAGRVAIVELAGLRVLDVGGDELDTIWRRGGLPRSYLGAEEESVAWRDDYISTFLERDLANLGVRIPPTTMRRFWTMVAHYHGQTWNGSELSRALAVSQTTVRRYLDALTDALVIRQLQPWFANIAKRQVRSPKVYVRDSGLLHRLLGLNSQVDLLGHPKVGASWEGFILEQMITCLQIRDPSFWSTHSGAELDLFATIGGRRLGFEFKRTDQPAMTASIRSSIDTLQLDHVFVVHAGKQRFAINRSVTALPAAELLMSGEDALQT